jgi:cytoskeletal protein CcmA (bactofilin family)
MSVQIEKNLRINGDLTAGEDLTVDCTFEGSIQVPGHHLTIAAGSQVHAAVSAQIVTVRGTFEGQIEAETLHVAQGATVTATVIAKKVAIQDGALVNASINTERARAAGDVARHRAAQRLTEATSSNEPSAGASRPPESEASSDPAAPHQE